MDVRKWRDDECLRAWDLDGREVTVTIEKVTPGEVGTEGGKKRMPFLHFVGKEKKFGLSAITNINTIGSLLGTFEADKWAGARITLYVTTTKSKAGMVDCIRVRNRLPEAGK